MLWLDFSFVITEYVTITYFIAVSKCCAIVIEAVNLKIKTYI